MDEQASDEKKKKKKERTRMTADERTQKRDRDGVIVIGLSAFHVCASLAKRVN